MIEQNTQRSLRSFTQDGYDKGAPVWKQALWFAVMNLVFFRWWCPRGLRVRLLRAFGATVGDGVFIRHRVRVLWPWKLTIGDDCWIGEDVWILNLEPVTVEHDVCLSQGAMLCTGSHDRRRVDFAYRNKPITVCSGAWVAVRATVLAGVTVGRGAVVGAGAVASKDLEDGETLLAVSRTVD